MGKRSEVLDREKLVLLGAVCPLGHLRMATRVITQMFDEIFQPSGLRATQFGVLGLIAVVGPATITHLADQAVMDRTTLTRNLKPLEEQGLVKIAPGEDRRSREVSITPHGEEVVAKAVPLLEAAHARVVEQLGDERRLDLLGDLRAVVALAPRPSFFSGR